MNNNITKEKIDTNDVSLNMNISINIDDGKNKVDKVINEFAESERLKQGVNKVKKSLITTTKIFISFAIIGFLLLIVLVALGIVS